MVSSTQVRISPRVWPIPRAGSALCVLTVSLLGRSAWGLALYSTGFEDPPFEAGSELVGKDGWVAPPPFSRDAALVQERESYEGRQAVRIRGRDLEPQDFINELTDGYYEAIGSYRRAVNFDTFGIQVVRVSVFAMLAGDEAPDGNNFFSASVAVRTALTDGDTAGTGELAISSDGHVHGYSGNDFVPTFLTSAPVTLNAWHHLELEVDIGARTYSFFVDGQALGTFDFDAQGSQSNPDAEYTNELRRGSLLVYAAPDSGPLRKHTYTAYFDTFSIEVVEPGE